MTIFSFFPYLIPSQESQAETHTVEQTHSTEVKASEVHSEPQTSQNNASTEEHQKEAATSSSNQEASNGVAVEESKSSEPPKEEPRVEYIFEIEWILNCVGDHYKRQRKYSRSVSGTIMSIKLDAVYI